LPVKKGFEEVQQTFKSEAVSTLYLPEVNETIIPKKPVKPKEKTEAQMQQEFMKEFDRRLDSMLKLCKEYYDKIKNERINWVPAPPRTDFRYCTACDSGRQQRWEREYEVWRKELLGKDEQFMVLTMQLYRAVNLVVPTEEHAAIGKILDPLYKLILDRCVTRIDLLIKNYGSDPARVHAIAKFGIGIERQWIFTVSDDKSNTDIVNRVLIPGYQALARMIMKAQVEYDYPIALNVQLIMQTERQFQLLTGEEDRVWDFNKVIDFNKFRMNGLISGKVNGKGGYMLAELKGENYFSAVPDKNCKLQWLLMGPNINKMEWTLIAGEARGAGGAITPAGTRDFVTNSKMRLDFCDDINNSDDTVEIFPFHHAQDNELWNVPKVGVQKMPYTNGILMTCFIDVERAKRMAAKYQNPEEVEKLKQQMLDKYKDFEKNNAGGLNGKDASQMSSADLQKLAQAMKSGKQVGEIAQTASMDYLFKVAPRNKDPKILMEKLDGRLLFPQNPGIEYAWFHLTLQQDPTSPYSLAERISSNR
jgi:hypothetical protein